MVVLRSVRKRLFMGNSIDFDKVFSGKPSVSKADSVLLDGLKDDFDGEPVETGNFGFGDFELVGHGEVTNEKCGRFSGYFYGCLRVDLHKLITLDGANYANMIYGKPFFHSCDKPSCPICFKYGWAVREAKSVEARLKEASKRFGLVEHIVVSVPAKDYGLSYEAMRFKVVKVLKSRGVVGGALIFHGFRFDKRKWCWYWSPHFHVLGFILGGYGKCRGCKKVCLMHPECNGFEKRTRKFYKTDGYIVKVLGKRKTVMGSAWYQLHHSSVKKGSVRFHVATWFGNVSYRKLKVTAEMRKAVCPICKHDLVKMRYIGRALDIWMLCYGGGFFADFEEEGFLRGSKEVVWQVVVERYGGDGYG